MRPVIARTLAEKHGTTPLEEKNRLDELTKSYYAEKFPPYVEAFTPDREAEYLDQ